MFDQRSLTSRDPALCRPGAAAARHCAKQASSIIPQNRAVAAPPYRYGGAAATRLRRSSEGADEARLDGSPLPHRLPGGQADGGTAGSPSSATTRWTITATGISVPPAAVRGADGDAGRRRLPHPDHGQVAEHLAARRPFPPRAVAITFDDGFASVGTLAAPILARYGLTATVYVITGMIGRLTHWTAYGPALPALPLLAWPQIQALARAGHRNRRAYRAPTAF